MSINGIWGRKAKEKKYLLVVFSGDSGGSVRSFNELNEILNVIEAEFELSTKFNSKINYEDVEGYLEAGTVYIEFIGDGRGFVIANNKNAVLGDLYRVMNGLI